MRLRRAGSATPNGTRRSATTSGCRACSRNHDQALACHKISESGNSGPGPNLTKVGDRLAKPAIARALANPTAPMPSFRHLPRQKFRAIVTFLAELK
jgi:hypothetical protein